MTNEEVTALSLKKKPFYGFVPYVPQKRDYGFELGAMWEEKNLYWIGGYTGFHIGRCMFSASETCQQYADVIGGVGGREGLTEGLLLGALRWQFISFPQFMSPSVRLLSGVMNVRGQGPERHVFVYGLGYGLSVAVHPAIDLKLNFRFGGGEKTWSQSFFTLSVKIDHVVNYFAQRLEAFGKKAVKATIHTTSGVIKGTGKIIKKGATVIHKGVKATGNVIVAPLKKDSKKPQEVPTTQE